MSECKVVKKIPCPPHRKKKPKKKKKTRRIGLLKRQLARISELRRRIEELSASIAQLTAFTNQIRSDVNTLQAQIRGPIAAPSIQEVLLSRLNTPIVVETDAGAISGTLIEVGTDYAAILEPTGAIVLIPLSEINSFV